MVRLLDRYGDSPEEMAKAGIDYAIRQVEDLLDNSVEGVHLYTMNKIDQIREIAYGSGLACSGRKTRRVV